MGTTLAIVGAYVLAGELAKGLASTNSTEKVVPTALERYEEVLKSYVASGQKLAPGVPKIANPETEWGIWVLRSIVSFVSKTGLASVLGMLASSLGKETEKFPNYEELGLMGWCMSARGPCRNRGWPMTLSSLLWVRCKARTFKTLEMRTNIPTLMYVNNEIYSFVMIRCWWKLLLLLTEWRLFRETVDQGKSCFFYAPK